MDFSLESFQGRKVRYFESGTSSPLQLVFVPGVFNAEIWRHQFRYFSGSHRTAAFDGWEPGFGFEQAAETLRLVLEEEDFRNAVLVSSGLGNAVVQQMEKLENVAATVITGPAKSYPNVPRRLYNLGVEAARREPKLFKKMFFSETTSYRIVRQLVEELEFPDYDLYRSFLENYRLRKPVKNTLVIHPGDDRFSSREFVDSMKQDATVGTIRKAGSFSFYEKPQEYNKALLDFLNKLEPFAQERELKKRSKRNRSLSDFAGQKVMTK